MLPVMKNIDNEKKKKILYIGIFVVVLILYHLAVKVYFGDDVGGFSTALDEYEFGAYLFKRYTSWSSRLVIETILVILLKNLVLCKIISIGICLLLAYSLYELSHKTSLWAVIMLILLYPITEMSSAGWVATSVNYLWPLSLGLYSLIIVDRLSEGRNAYWWQIILSIAAEFIAVNQEQYCVVHLAFLLMYTFYAFRSRRLKNLWIFIVHYAVAIGMLIFILTCPGNWVRKASEVTRWMLAFYEKNGIDKLIDGFENTFSEMLSSTNILFLVFLVFLFICVLKKTSELRYRIIGAFPCMLAIVVSFGELDTNGYFSAFAGLITSDTDVTADNWVKVSSYLPLFLYGMMAACIVMSFFIILDDLIQAAECTFLFGVAIASRVIMGFSPTLYASDNRTFIFCYALMAFIMLRITEWKPVDFSGKEITYGKYAGVILCAIVVLNNIAAAGNTF